MQRFKTIKKCATCGSENIVCDAWVAWNPEANDWEIETVFEEMFCHECEASCNVDEEDIDLGPVTKSEIAMEYAKEHGMPVEELKPADCKPGDILSTLLPEPPAEINTNVDDWLNADWQQATDEQEQHRDWNPPEEIVSSEPDFDSFHHPKSDKE